ncbi:MAG: HAMP domain-containing histidine kinase [Gammaproteobacteria bacterium]|nr:HAMP domain-containing histidine kinase [Gammaproteobacteria bacterium]
MRHARFSRRHSITGKLVITFLLIAVLFVILVSGSISHVFRTHFEENLQPHLIQYMEYVQGDIGIPANRLRATALAKRLNIAIHIIDEQGTWSSSGMLKKKPKIDIRHKISKNGVDYGIATVGEHEYFISVQNGTMFLFDIPNLHPSHKGRGLLPIIVLLFVLLLLYHFTHRIIRPISTLKEGIKRIGDGEISHRIQLRCRDELGELADNINDMADKIEEMLEAKRQLLLAISHELRSPLTRAKVSLALIDEHVNKESLQGDLNEMERLIEELLETERLSGNHRALNKQDYVINTLIDELISQHFSQDCLEIHMTNIQIRANIDTARIKLMLKNLLENAIRHTPEGSHQPTVYLTTERNHYTIRIVDTGHGIEQQHIPHITEAFYRADSSRQRETGGYGLGLYLCKVIAEAHGGRLIIESKLNKGTTIRVEIPCDDKQKTD